MRGPAFVHTGSSNARRSAESVIQGAQRYVEFFEAQSFWDSISGHTKQIFAKQEVCPERVSNICSWEEFTRHICDFNYFAEALALRNSYLPLICRLFQKLIILDQLRIFYCFEQQEVRRTLGAECLLNVQINLNFSSNRFYRAPMSLGLWFLPSFVQVS